MRRILLGFFTALALGGAVAAQGDGDAQEVIDAQIEAFLRDDVAEAFTYASPGIRRLFGTAENFGAMVRQGYPMVWRPAERRYLQSEGAGTQQRQIVQIVDAEGRLHLLEYDMIATERGWRIDGVRILQAPDLGV
ncbi:hypothetical protein Ga0609869_003247 [Rhodovulum iodosum]|uniref:DUF4864 domain-containing protein n=1 Tax=Rhodovulum iodosum TaxID=68291 RepID=A0ABV3XXK7_9RHOB|nr:DUF4864 domain-containing protein [Rhodovulum robiginosum]RSK34073.1 DUF4864 domain-containing protein [Rhodovulum robiginosum]